MYSMGSSWETGRWGTMIDPAVLLRIALSFPPWHGDRGESPEARAELYRPVMEAIAEEAKDEKQAALLLAQAIEDTHLARYVLESRCMDGPRGARCDNGRSRGPFQVGTWCRDDGVRVGLRLEAHCALRAAWGGIARCREQALTPWHGAFAGLAARDCHWAPAAHRVDTMRRILRGLRERP